jgi:hypothetical protein
MLTLYLIGLLAVFFPGKSAALPVSSNCTQEYDFILKTENLAHFWIKENLYGECGQSTLIQIMHTSDERIMINRTALATFDSWAWTQAFTRSVAHASAQELGTQRIGGISVRSPDRNDRLYNNYKAKGHISPSEWNLEKGVQGIDNPKVTGVASLTLLYHSPDGLYFNYRIKKAFLFKDSDYLLLFTENKIMALGNNTTHGYLLYRIKKS